MYTRYLHSWLISASLALALLPLAAARAEPAVAEPFRAYYDQHQGMRLLGYPLTDLVEADGYAAQYFEKGRLEDHRADRVAAGWSIMSGRLAAELIESGAPTTVTGTSLTYATLKRRHALALRHPAPDGFVSGVAETPGGVFVPYDAGLRRASGYIVPRYFWDYITREDLFPGGWLHDIGLPLTDVFPTRVYKNGQVRDITVQAFERTVLTSDPQNPPDWHIERGNIGADAVRRLPPLNTIEIPAPGARVTLPLALLARVGQPGQRLLLTLRWEDGTRLLHTSAVLQGEDGRGVLIDSLAIPPEHQPQHPWTQTAQLEISDASGAILATQPISVLHPEDPDTREITLYWIEDSRLKAESRRILRTDTPEAAALEALLWGPAQRSADDAKATALPTPEQVLAFPGRTAAWGPRVTLRSLTLTNGLARADFSQELRAYDGDALRASQIHAQITRTLLQFRPIRNVQITIDGERDGALEP